MEAFEGVVVGELQDLSHENNNRTKLERPSSPIIFTIASPHLSSGEVGGYNTNEENIVLENNNKEENITSENSNNINDEEENMKLKNSNNKVNSNDNDNNNNNQSNSTNIKLTPAKSFNGVNSTTAEDEDTARLLILLSQGNSKESSTINYYLDRNYSPPSTKFSSKKYIETSSNVDRKSGVFVYECKTCNRTFPSFQALGGHRASHRKPKNIAAEELKKRHFSSVFSDDYDYDYDFDPSSSSFSRNNNHSIMRKTATSRKTHECSYCGAEFTSGQALGGHMRRHRGSNGNNNSNYHYNPNNNNNVNNTQPLLALSPSLMSSLSVNQDSLENKKQKTNKDNKDALSLSLSLSLDLNLPSTPPPENDQKNQESTDIEFIPEKISSPSPEKRHEQQQQQQQQQTANKESELLISTKPTLLDCQY